jgi:hypothetical protein
MPAVQRKELSLAIKDLVDGVCSIYIWPMLGWQEIKQALSAFKSSVLSG